MPKVKLNISRLSISDKIAKCRQMIAAMTGNPKFPTPNPPLTTVTTALNDLEGATNDAQSARQSIVERKLGQLLVPGLPLL